LLPLMMVCSRFHASNARETQDIQIRRRAPTLDPFVTLEGDPPCNCAQVARNGAIHFHWRRRRLVHVRMDGSDDYELGLQRALSGDAGCNLLGTRP